MNFWYKKSYLFSDIRKWFSDIRNSCWFSDIRNWFSDIRKSFSDIRKSYEFLISENKLEFLIRNSGLFSDIRKSVQFSIKTLEADTASEHVNISQTRHIVYVFTTENFSNKNCTLNFKWQVSILCSLYGLHEYSGAVHRVHYILLTVRDPDSIVPSTRGVCSWQLGHDLVCSQALQT